MRKILLALCLCFSLVSPSSAAVNLIVKNLCSNIVAPVANKTWCFQQSDGDIYVWNGAAWVTAISTTGIITPSTIVGTANQVTVTQTAPGQVTLSTPDIVPKTSTFAGLPAAGVPGRLRIISTSAGGVWIDTGVAWLPLKSEIDVSLPPFNVSPSASSTTNSTGLQLAIDTANTLGGRVVSIPGGTYAITSLTMKSNVTLKGAGRGVTILAADDNLGVSTNVVLVANSSTNVTLRDFTTHGTASADTVPYVFVEIRDDDSNITIDNIEAYWYRTGAVRVSTNVAHTTSRVTVKDCYFHDIQTAAMVSVTAGGAISSAGPGSDFKLLHNTIENVGYVGTLMHSFYMQGVDKLDVTDNTIIGQFGTVSIGSAAALSRNTNLTYTSNRHIDVGTHFFFNVTGTITGNVFNVNGNNTAIQFYIPALPTQLDFSSNFITRTIHGLGLQILGDAGALSRMVVSSNLLIDEDATGGGSAGIQFNTPAPDYAVISNNLISGFGGGVQVLDGNFHHIIGNTVATIGHTGAGILFSNSVATPSNSIVESNVLAVGVAERPLTDAVLGQNFFKNNVTVAGSTSLNVPNQIQRIAFDATATVADGGTITHSLGTTPTSCVAVGGAANDDIIHVTALGATTFTVSIKKRSDGTSGTSQTIYWDCKKK
jgi:hypothetical protein